MAWKEKICNYIESMSSKAKKMSAVGLFVVLLLTGFVWQLSPAEPQGAPERTFILKQNDSASEIAANLADQGFVRSSLAFRMLVRLRGASSEIQAGVYHMNGNLSSWQILSNLTQGKGRYYAKITIPEGYTVNQIAELLESKGLARAEDFKKLARETQVPFVEESSPPEVEYPVEGFLFPDTYQLALDKPAEQELMDSMLQNFQDQTKELRTQLPPNMSFRQWVVLASLVEREVRKIDEQPLVASIFWKRLKIDMPLQSCASIQYILGYQKLELSIADTQIPSPYNTYLHGGFPPGPVSNPGLSALKAALNPPDTDYLFFVAQSNGSHIFSKTYEEHLAAIEIASQP